MTGSRRAWTIRLCCGPVLLALVALSTGCSSGSTEPVPVATSSSARAHLESLASTSARVNDPASTGSNAWRLTKPASQRQIEGYTTKVSAHAGEPVGLMVSTDAPTFVATAFRIGAYRGGTGRKIWESGETVGHRQAWATFANLTTRPVVARWSKSLLVPTAGWPPGFYVFKLVASDGWQFLIPFVVKAESAAGKVALVAPVTTWQAYNAWGGFSLYEGRNGRRSWAVSFDRPYDTPATGTGLIPIVVRAERLRIPLAYLTNIDIDADKDALTGAIGYVSMGHDEYWTPTMRDRVASARDRGTNLAFIGANTMYWRIRLANRPTGPNRLIVGYRSDAFADPAPAEQDTARFRDAPSPEPENNVTGMQYECFPVDTDYRIASPGWWGFRGTGVGEGDRFEHLVGIEADRVYPITSTPRPLQILSYSDYTCRGTGTSSESTYYTTSSGAGVIDLGTLRWTCALKGRCGTYQFSQRTISFVRMVTDNVLEQFAQGPVGRRFPAEDNVSQFNLPTANQVSAS
jgi:N,N-dimethylformamidase beta subunit-like, C-terminal